MSNKEMAMVDRTGAGQQTGLDRRDVLKKTALVGGIAWAAPVVTATNAWAANGVCTPRCEPTGTAVVTNVTAEKAGCGEGTGGLGTRPFIVNFIVTYTSTVDCKCSPDPAPTGTRTITRQLPKPGATTQTIEIDLDFVCLDTTGDVWAVVCPIAVTVTTTGNCQAQTGTVKVDEFIQANCRNECALINQPA